jgi:hypothetical protein
MSKLPKSKSIKYDPKKLSVALPNSLSKRKSTYDKDFYKWVMDQANFLKRKEFSNLDLEHLIEEVESLGRSERRALESYIVVLLLHLLKIEYQPSNKSKSWDNSVKISKHRIKKLLKENPSLKPKVPEIWKDAYYTARLEAISETGLDDNVFPKNCPWKQEDCLSS